MNGHNFGIFQPEETGLSAEGDPEGGSVPFLEIIDRTFLELEKVFSRGNAARIQTMERRLTLLDDELTRFMEGML